ncbi:MAG: DUF4386 domain-containing protein [Betaproteobacteria bacterium]
MPESLAGSSPRFTARMAGFFWLMTAVTGSLALVGDRSIVAGDAAATAANIVAHESSFRLGLAANIVATVCYLAATVLVYHLLKPVNRNVSLLAAFFSLAGCAVSGLNFVFYLAPLAVLGGAQYLSAFTIEQLQALALTFLRLRAQAFYVSHVFFGLHCLLVGALILRSTFLPRFVGALMTFGGLGWLTMSFANLLSPPLGRSLDPYILAPGAIGEITLSLWLLLMGVNVQRWKERAGAVTA